MCRKQSTGRPSTMHPQCAPCRDATCGAHDGRIEKSCALRASPSERVRTCYFHPLKIDYRFQEIENKDKNAVRVVPCLSSFNQSLKFCLYGFFIFLYLQYRELHSAIKYALLFCPLIDSFILNSKDK